MIAMCSSLVLQIIKKHDILYDVSLNDWDRLLPQARRVGIVAKFYTALEKQGQLARIPLQVQPHLEAAAIIAAEHERRTRWECNRIQRALFDLPQQDFPVVLLKGAAYVIAGLPCARGRLVSDVDIMVPKACLSSVETVLHQHGWESVKNSDYDDHYYRQWMHELPPLRHRLRGTVVDVHHTILPTTSRLNPDPDQLIAASRSLPGTPFRIFAPTDMVLHSAAHAFHDGELANPLRDLLDLHELLSYFDTHESDFWDTLPQRARQLHLDRPLFYGLRYAQRFLGTSVPAIVTHALQSSAPFWPVRVFMDRLVTTIMLAESPHSIGVVAARWLLYVRSHWLRMPPRLLIRHLLIKAAARLRCRS